MDTEEYRWRAETTDLKSLVTKGKKELLPGLQGDSFLFIFSSPRIRMLLELGVGKEGIVKGH